MSARGRRRTIRRVQALVDAGVLDPRDAPAAERVSDELSLAVTPDMADLIDPTDPADPIARQFVPAPEELVVTPDELSDPVGDDAYEKVPGLTHRYPDRVLLKPLHVCSVYCRYCFRREKVGSGGQVLSPAELDRALDYIRAHDEIWEVILTGGDPFVLAPRRMRAIVDALDRIEHVAVIRVHTRVPVAEPARVVPDLLAALRAESKATYIVVHCNHPREITDAAAAAFAQIADAGFPLLSQSVLLRGVNDDPETLETLFRQLVRLRAKPYYLHHCDLARGTSRFRTSIGEGQDLMRALRGRVSGICQPTYILDIPGGHGKVPIGPPYVQTREDGRLEVTDHHGIRHDYPPQS